jgi:uncharacterized protein YkwD
VLGLALMPVVFVVAFFGLVLAAEAMGVGSVAQLERTVQELLVFTGLTNPPPTPEAAPVESAPSPTPFQPQLTESVEASLSPSPTASPSATTTPSATLTLTPTPTVTTTATPTLTPSPTVTPSATIAATATRTRTPTQPPTRTVTRTLPPPTASNTPEGQPEPTATSDGQPTLPPDPATPTSAPTASTCAASANAGVESEVVELVNDERVSQGLAAYSVDSRLRAAARVHATDMACNHFTSHTGSDGSSVRDRVERQGYSWSWIGENYYVSSSGAQTAFDWWMNSTLHRNNLLSPNYTQFGVGYVYDADSDYGGYFVVVFARPG